MSNIKFKIGDKVMLKNDTLKEVGTIVRIEYSESIGTLIAMCDFPGYRNLQVSSLDSLEKIYTVENNDIWKELLKYIAENNKMESGFLSPTSKASVDVIGLLNKIAELRGISEEENGMEFNEIADEIELNKER